MNSRSDPGSCGMRTDAVRRCQIGFPTQALRDLQLPEGRPIHDVLLERRLSIDLDCGACSPKPPPGPRTPLPARHAPGGPLPSRPTRHSRAGATGCRLERECPPSVSGTKRSNSYFGASVNRQGGFTQELTFDSIRIAGRPAQPPCPAGDGDRRIDIGLGDVGEQGTWRFGERRSNGPVAECPAVTGRGWCRGGYRSQEALSWRMPTAALPRQHKRRSSMSC